MKILFLVPAYIAVEAESRQEAEIVANDLRDTLSDTRHLDPRVIGVRVDETVPTHLTFAWQRGAKLPTGINDGVPVLSIVEHVEVAA